MITTKQLNSGNWGLFVGGFLVSVAKTEERIKTARTAVEEAVDEAYHDGHTEGYDEGHSDGLFEGEESQN